jgi:hypothetical protein
VAVDGFEIQIDEPGAQRIEIPTARLSITLA